MPGVFLDRPFPIAFLLQGFRRQTLNGGGQTLRRPPQTLQKFGSCVRAKAQFKLALEPESRWSHATAYASREERQAAGRNTRVPTIAFARVMALIEPRWRRARRRVLGTINRFHSLTVVAAATSVMMRPIAAGVARTTCGNQSAAKKHDERPYFESHEAKKQWAVNAAAHWRSNHPWRRIVADFLRRGRK
jgi:hypothetical protein